MNRSKYRQKELDMGIFRTTPLMACGGTQQDFDKAWTKWSGNEVPEHGPWEPDGRTMRGNGYYAIWCAKPRPSFVAHEAVHLVCFILDDHGIPKNDELIAYMVQYVVRKYLDAFT